MDERLAYERALRELRRDIGCTWERLSGSEPLLQALEERLSRRGREVTIEGCIDELRDLIGHLSDPTQRDPLLVALRLHPEYQERTLTARRDNYNRDLRESRSDVDMRTLERRENAAIRTLAAWLATDRAATEPSADVDAEGRALRHFRIDHRETWYKIGPGRVLREQLLALRVVALVPNASLFAEHFTYQADRRAGVIEIEPMFGCSLDGTTRFRDGTALQYLCTPRPLPAGETHHLVIHVRVHSEQECYPRLMTNVGPNEQYMAKHIDFAADSVPERVWRFAHLAYPDAVHNPRQTLLPGGPHRLVSQHWHDLKVGLCYGIAWEW